MEAEGIDRLHPIVLGEANTLQIASVRNTDAMAKPNSTDRMGVKCLQFRKQNLYAHADFTKSFVDPIFGSLKSPLAAPQQR